MRNTPAAGGDERDRRVISQSRTDVHPVLDHWRAPLVAVPMIHEGTALGLITASRRENDGIVEVSVADTGVGIAPEDQQTIFEEFRQVGAVDKRVEGTALSRKFVESHGGRIWVESRVGQGSTFTFTLPEGRSE